MICPKCQGRKLRRVKRKETLRSRIATVFGYFPWRCSECESGMLLKVRVDDSAPRRKSARVAG